ncbi:transcriptional regulator, GntR family [Pseudooceanicola antarcticus]|uniref:Pyruvate dehydrogenase complex repressor n=1 Tax=Pseudooceanicola antarcticus TaxID=1247613 RepID=A0A285IG06_9RHOB|nr:FCD domain-containing protein [Pseudooceanicola antarcticus]PJE29063.1 GntR family transcriptional regulator [Pseudooceanicola antarcticus]SNY46904.1 transcriptional regulator, GntR family [Pseudooceanicola antarcticus]
MPFQPIPSEKRADAVVRQIELLILRGLLRPGERLPAERELAERMEVSRPSLREALADLQARGLLQSRAGSGVYVADVLGAAFSPALVALFQRHEEAVFDYLSFRRDLEGQAAERAARDGLAADLALVDRCFNRMEQAKDRADPAEEARLDAEFHLAILEASHNIVLLHMMRSMLDLLRSGVFYNRDIMFDGPGTSERLLAQHRAINTALQARDPEAARQAVEAHLDYVREAYKGHLDRARREEIAQMRLARS